MKSYKEIKAIQMRTVIMLAILAGLAIVTVMIKSTVVSALGLPQVQESLKNSSLGKTLASEISRIANDFSYYSYSQWFGKTYMQIAALAAIVLSFPLFSKEREKRTIYLLIGRMGRWEIYSTKVLIGYVAVLITIFGGGIAYILTANIMGYALPSTMAFAWTFRIMVGTLLLYQIGAYTSLLFKSQVKPFLLDIAIYIGLGISGFFKQTKFLDLFGYMGGKTVLKNPTIGIFPTIIVLLICAVIFTLGYLQFRSMDIC